MTLGLFTPAIPIIDSTKMALFLGASVAVGIAYTFVPWLYEEPEDENDFEELDVRITQTSNESTVEESTLSTQIQIIHRRKIVRYDSEVGFQQSSMQSKINSDKTSSEKSTQFLSINVPTGFNDETQIQLCPQAKISSTNNQHLNTVDPHQIDCITYKNYQNVFQDTYTLNNDYQKLGKKKKVEMNINPRQKVTKPPRAHPPNRKRSLKRNSECQSPLSPKKLYVDVQTQTIDISKYQTQSSASLNHPEHSEKISKLKESSQDLNNVNEIHGHSLYPEINVVTHGNESSTLPFSSSANGDQGDSSSKNQKTAINMENAQKKNLRKKSVKFVAEKNCYNSSESYGNSYEQSVNRKMESISFVNRCKRMLSFNRNEKDLVKSKSSISSAMGQVPSGHSTPIERSSDSSEDRQGYSSDAFGKESKQKHQLNKSGNLSRRPKVLLMARGIPSCVIQDLNLVHEKSNNKYITSRIISETLTNSDESKNHGKHNSGIENPDFTTIGSNNDINNNNSNYNSGWISRLNKDMHEVIGGIRKYIKVPKLNGNFQPSNKNSGNKDLNNNNNHYNDYYNYNENNINNKYNNESSINYSSWKFKSSSTLNKSHSLTFLKTDINSNKKCRSLPELKDGRFFSRWSNFLPC